MLRFSQFLTEKKSGDGVKELPWDHNPKIGWWKDHDHVTLYHGTHDSNVAGIAKHGLKSPEKGSTAGHISMALDPHTSHGYASMTGGESHFRSAGYGGAKTVPHHERSVMVYKVPRHFIEKHHSDMRGNMESTKTKLTDKAEYERHAASGKPDHQHYMATEVRLPHVPKEYLVGRMKKFRTKEEADAHAARAKAMAKKGKK